MDRHAKTLTAALIAALALGSCATGGGAGSSEAGGTAPSNAPSPAAPGSPAGTLPPGALTIATLGDSLTQGDCDDSGRGYPGRLKTLVDPLRPGTQIVNVGRSGWASADLINGLNGDPSQLSQALAAHPNVAMVWIGSNDLWYLYEFGPEPMTAEAEQQDLATYTANIDRILRDLTGDGAMVFVALLDDQSKRPVAANPDPAEPVFPATTSADLARMSAHVTAYNDAIRQKAAQYGAVTVDFYNTTIFTDAATLCSDGNHPNDTGYDRIAQIWFAALEPHLT